MSETIRIYHFHCGCGARFTRTGSQPSAEYCPDCHELVVPQERKGHPARSKRYGGISFVFPEALKEENRLPPLDREQQRQLNDMWAGKIDRDAVRLPG